MKKQLFFAAFLFGVFYNAQVGIGTSIPKATFDVVATPSDVTKFDGIIAPRISGSDLRAKKYTSDQTGAIVYVIAADLTPSGQTLDVNSVGYYYFDGDSSVDKWVKLQSGNETEPWKVQGTDNLAKLNTDNIFQEGKVAIGTTSASPVSSKQLDVIGDLRTQYIENGNYYGIDTNFSSFGIPISMLYSADGPDVSSASKSSTVMVYPGMAMLQSSNGSAGSSIAAFSNSTGGNFGMVANNSDQSISSSVWVYNDSAASKLSLSHNKTNAEATNVTIEKAKGVTYSYSNASGAVQGEYTFPRNNGNANQVLVTDGSTSSASLSWKDISAINTKIRTIASGIIASDDYTLLIAGNVTMPSASANTGKIYNLINDTSGSVTVSGTFRINGGNFTNYTLNNTDFGRGIAVQSTGSAWVVVSRY